MTDAPSAVRELILPGASVSVLAVKRPTGEKVAAAAPDRALAPASNTKLITAGLALDRLGPDWRYGTRLLGDGPVDDGILDGDLVLVGMGAPDVDASDLDRLAADIARQVGRVTGDLRVDGTVFPDGQLGPGWTWGDSRHYYGARSSAAAVDRNQVTVTVTQTGDGDGLSISVDPDSQVVELDSDVTVAPDATTDDLKVFTDPESGAITVTGALPPEADTVEEFAPVRHPERHCGLVLQATLAEAGVAVGGQVRIDDGTGSHEVTDAALEAVVRSAPVRGLIRDMNVPSDNFVAEQLARTIAHVETGEGSWDAWESLVREHFETLGVDTVRIRDGSGLSRYNLVPADGMIAHLRWVDEQDWREAFFDSLPTPGKGTLSSRLAGTPVAAKTGTITGTSALSGVVRHESAPDVLFSVLQGGLTREEGEEARGRQDAFVRWLTELV